jgi:diketogulonate reductase-like aldo/keto reductase
VIVIPGASSVALAESNAEAADLELTDDEDAELTAASDEYQPVRGAAVAGGIARKRAEEMGARVRRIADGLRT